MFERSKDAPKTVVKAGLTKWYSEQDDQTKVKIGRYAERADGSSKIAFLTSMMDLAMKDENYSFAVMIGKTASDEKMDDMQRFTLNEELIEAYIGTEDYDNAKTRCYENLDLFPKVKDELVAAKGGMPEKLNCRNRLVDVLVGIESAYDTAQDLLDRFYKMGLITEEDLNLRRQSLKIHRLQRSFDGVYTYRPKE